VIDEEVRGMKGRLGIATTMVVLAGAVSASVSHAATVAVAGYKVVYTAGPGEVNQLTVSGYTFTDPGAVITAGTGCTSTSAHVATCNGAIASDYDIALLDGNDTGAIGDAVDRRVSGPLTTLFELYDEIFAILLPGPNPGGGAIFAQLDGGDGNDVLRIDDGSLGQALLVGGAGNDQLFGNAETDAFNGGPGADVMKGGDGTDGATYFDRTASVYVSLDGVTNDGEAGERDNVAADVENVATGSGNDTVAGSASANRLRTGDGDDRVTGGSGSDNIDGGAGNDALYGDDGTDTIIDGVGADYVQGGTENDFLEPHGGYTDPAEHGADQYRGGAGQDTLFYTDASVGVSVTMDEASNDGIPGDGDNVHSDVEIVYGTSHDDEMVGNAGSNWFYGDDGSDRLIGAGGIDILRVSNRQGPPSHVDGGAGTDVISSAYSGDVVACGAGVDILGSDTLHPADCEVVVPFDTVTPAIEMACGDTRCAATINKLRGG
jgi:Ca2+-binding RTX toxin-like protein